MRVIDTDGWYTYKIFIRIYKWGGKKKKACDVVFTILSFSLSCTSSERQFVENKIRKVSITIVVPPP